MAQSILILNGSIQGVSGNSHKLLLKFIEALKKIDVNTHITQLNLVELQLNSKLSAHEKEAILSEAFVKHQIFVFATGTYWDSWGSPMQYLLETMTPFEGSEAILGKPAAVLVTMHSVGGKEVCSRLQGVLSTMGFLIPPMAHIAYSLQQHLIASTKIETADFAEDFWNLEDLNIIAHNLLEAAKKSSNYQAWEVDKKDPKRLWF